MRTAVVMTLFAAACHSERVDQLEARLAELRAETDRLSRDVADLRKGSGAAASPAAASSSQALEASALSRALLSQFARSLPPLPAADGPLDGVWRRALPEPRPGGAVEEVLQLASGGRLCGYGQLPPPSSEKRPFWGRWERHGRALLLVKDRWVGDHNEYDAELRVVEAVDASRLTTNDGRPSSAARVAWEQWRPLSSLYEGRDVPIPGLPKWCFREE